MKKKFLLMTCSVLLASQLQAAEPFSVLEEATINKLSPDGRWGVSYMFGNVSIFDFANGKRHDYDIPEEDYSVSYFTGHGNCVSSEGIVVGSTTSSNVASYWENGEWKELTDKDESYAYGITPDGSVICGVMPSTTTGELTTVPVIWKRSADGVYGQPEPLPYPAKDFTGRDPQSVTAVCISADARTIVGQIVDYKGVFMQPIVYRLDDKGEWSYELIHSELLNPADIKLPEWIDEPTYPIAANYMSPEAKERYDAAYQAYVESGYNWELMPDAKDYLTEEELQAWQADADKYNAWVEFFESYDEVYNSVIDGGAVIFEYNNVCMSENGKYLGMSQALEIVTEGSYWPETKYVPWVFNLETGEYHFYENEESLTVTSVSDNCEVLAGTAVGMGAQTPPQGFGAHAGETTFVPLIEYLAGYPDAVEWMKKAMTHDGVVLGYEFDENSGEYKEIVENGYMITGLPVASADMSVIATWTTSNFWDVDNMDKPSAYSYVMELTSPSGAGIVSPSVAADTEVSVVDGVIVLNGDVVALSVYDLNGRVVLDVANPAAQIETGLASGLYVIKAVAANGEVTTVKAVF